jgi:hypothetical protein
LGTEKALNYWKKTGKQRKAMVMVKGMRMLKAMVMVKVSGFVTGMMMKIGMRMPKAMVILKVLMKRKAKQRKVMVYVKGIPKAMLKVITMAITMAILKVRTKVRTKVPRTDKYLWTKMSCQNYNSIWDQAGFPTRLNS